MTAVYDFQIAWRNHLKQGKSISNTQRCLYWLLCQRDLSQMVFAPITNSNKLANGRQAYAVLANSLFELRWLKKHILRTKNGEPTHSWEHELAEADIARIAEIYGDTFTMDEFILLDIPNCDSKTGIK